jgi:hypothetical protein
VQPALGVDRLRRLLRHVAIAGRVGGAADGDLVAEALDRRRERLLETLALQLARRTATDVALRL